MELDARTFALAWQAVAVASEKKGDRPILDRAVCVEQYLGVGVRLVATDSYMLLTAWVPATGLLYGEPAEPALDEAPDVVFTLMDPDRRALSLAAYAAHLTGGEDADPLTVRLLVGGEAFAPVDFASEQTLFAVDTWANIELPGLERVTLRCADGRFPSWRAVLPRAGAVEVDAIALNPDLLARVGKVAKVYAAGGADGSTPGIVVVFRWAGALGAALVTYRGADPAVWGVVMPCRIPDLGASPVDVIADQVAAGASVVDAVENLRSMGVDVDGDGPLAVLLRSMLAEPPAATSTWPTCSTPSTTTPRPTTSSDRTTPV